MPPAIIDDTAHPSNTAHAWHQQPAQHRVRRIPCGRCSAVIEHGSRAQWSSVSRLVNSHWEACPGRPHVAVMSRCVSPLVPLPPRSVTASPLLSPFAGGDGGAGAGMVDAAPVQQWTMVLPPPADVTSQSSRLSSVEAQGQRNNTTQAWMIPSGWERKRKTENQRRLELENDEYTADVTATKVTCVGCRKEISLDKRSRYYPGLWTKHRSKCPDIERLERTKHGRSGSLLNGQMRRPAGDMIDMGGIATASSLQANETRILHGSGDYREPGEHGALRLNRAEQSRERRLDTAVVHDQGRWHPSQQTASSSSSSSSDLSSEDEDDDEANLLHVPFPTLNWTFYQCNKSEEWTYRYATNDEILTNLYAP